MKDRKEESKRYYEKNKERIKEKQKDYYKIHCEKCKEYQKEYRKNNIEKCKQYRENNKELIKERTKEYVENNKELIKQKRIEYDNKNRTMINNYFKNKYKNDENYRIAKLCRVRIRRALKGKLKTMKTQELVGCSWKELADYLETTKIPEKYYSDVHIDHIKPCSSFDLTDPKQLKECFHYTNLQYLTAQENLKKGSHFV